MTDTIAMDPAEVSAIAAKVAQTGADFWNAPPPTVEGGVYNATTAHFCNWVTEVTAVHASNRDVIVKQLVNLANQLYASSADFLGMDEEYSSVLSSVVNMIGQVTQAGDSSTASVGSAPAGSGSAPVQSGL